MMNGFGTGNDNMLYQIEDGAIEFLNLQEEDIGGIKSEVMESVEKASEEIGGS
jgi:ribosomal protein L27